MRNMELPSEMADEADFLILIVVVRFNFPKSLHCKSTTCVSYVDCNLQHVFLMLIAVNILLLILGMFYALIF